MEFLFRTVEIFDASDDLRYKYHMSRFFEYQISNRNEVAWRIDGANRTIDRVKRIMGKYSPLVSYKTEEGRGEYFKEMD